MGFFKDLQGKLFSATYEEDDYIDEEEFEEAEAEQRTSIQAPAEEKAAYGRRTADNGVGLVSRASSIEMKVVTPTKFDSVTQIADLLLEKKTVLLNLENTNKETAKRLIDFLSGVAYALNGDIQKVADNTFAVTPNNVAVSNESVVDEAAPASEEEEQY